MDDYLSSGDLELIAKSASEQEILENFGPDSFEYLVYEQKLADKVWEQRKSYVVPGATCDPRCNYKVLRRWIADFHDLNDMKLPKGFYSRDKRALVGMFNGMVRSYKIRI